jgi:hypothetical protein
MAQLLAQGRSKPRWPRGGSASVRCRRSGVARLGSRERGPARRCRVARAGCAGRVDPCVGHAYRPRAMSASARHARASSDHRGPPSRSAARRAAANPAIASSQRPSAASITAHQCAARRDGVGPGAAARQLHHGQSGRPLGPGYQRHCRRGAADVGSVWPSTPERRRGQPAGVRAPAGVARPTSCSRSTGQGSTRATTRRGSTACPS